MNNALEKKYLALIPARGGSKSIPHKSIADLRGTPLLGLVLNAIGKSHVIDRAVVTTDDEKIAAVAREYGGETPFLRPRELAGDDAPMIPVVEHALRFLEEKEGYAPEYVLLIQPTSPFVRAEQIDTLFNRMVTRGADSAITMIRVPRVFHPYHVRRETPDGWLEFEKTQDHYTHPTRQSDPPRWAFGSMYWFRRDLFLKEKKIEVGRRVGLEIDSLSAFDINEPMDLEVARILFDKYKA